MTILCPERLFKMPSTETLSQGKRLYLVNLHYLMVLGDVDFVP